MVSPIKKYASDPGKRGRGPGDYYERSYKGDKDWYSKYSEHKDEIKVSTESPYAAYKYRHAGDNPAYVKQGKKVANKKKI
jgi:hypothetical protein